MHLDFIDPLDCNGLGTKGQGTKSPSIVVYNGLNFSSYSSMPTGVGSSFKKRCRFNDRLDSMELAILEVGRETDLALGPKSRWRRRRGEMDKRGRGTS